MLKIENLTFAYKNQDSPYNFNLLAKPGTITAITGPSGIGKSTFLDLIAGFLTPASGTILLDNQNIVSLPPQKRPMSILFQADNLFEHLSVRANLALAFSQSPPDKEKQICDALAKVGLADQVERPANQLSGGQKQRVALARTLLRNQPIVLLDEPFANLDAKTANTMRQLVKTLTVKNNWITILVSHLDIDISSLADNIYPLESDVVAS